MDEPSIIQTLFGTAGVFIYWGLYIVTGIACAYYVYQDSIKQDRRALNVHPYCWAGLTLIGGVWTLLAYWLMQHSSLVKSAE